MKANNANKSLDLILTKVNNQYVLANREDLINFIESENTPIVDQVAEQSPEEAALTQVKISDPTQVTFAKVQEISRDSKLGNSWINPVDSLIVIDDESTEKLQYYIEKLENKSNELYEHLTDIVVNKYKINDLDKREKIDRLYELNDPKLDSYLDLVDNVIYNVEADWNDYLCIENGLNLFNKYTVERSLEEGCCGGAEGCCCEHSIDDAMVQTEMGEEDELAYVAPVVVNCQQKSYNVEQLIAENETDSSRDVQAELSGQSNEEINNYISEIASQLNFVQNLIDDKTALYTSLASEQQESASKNITQYLVRLEDNSQVAKDIIAKIAAADAGMYKDLFAERSNNTKNNLKVISKLEKYIDISASDLSALNEEITSLKTLADNLLAKYSAAYDVAYENYSKYAKELNKRNSKLEKAAAKAYAKEEKARLRALKKQERDFKKNHGNSDDYKLAQELIKNYKDGSLNGNTIVDVCDEYDLFANPASAKVFRKKLAHKIDDLLKLGRKTPNDVDANEYLINEYFKFINSELGIISELSELAGLFELKRTKLISEIAETEVKAFADKTNVKAKMNFTIRANFSYLKLLCGEIMVLKTIYLHRTYVDALRAQARKQCHELATFIEWEQRLNWWCDATREAIANAADNKIYGQDENIQYIHEWLEAGMTEYDEMMPRTEGQSTRMVADEEGTCSCGCCSGETKQPTKVLVMKFERTIGTATPTPAAKDTTKVIVQKPKVQKPVLSEEELSEKEKERLRRLKNKGMTKAGYRIEALINETKEEIRDIAKSDSKAK